MNAHESAQCRDLAGAGCLFVLLAALILLLPLALAACSVARVEVLPFFDENEPRALREGGVEIRFKF